MITIIEESKDELCHRISAGGDEQSQYAVIRQKVGSNKESLVNVLRCIIHELDLKTNRYRIRVQIKDELCLQRALEALQNNGWTITKNNKNGNCLHIWTNGSKKSCLSHWTNDNLFMQVDEHNFVWFLECI